MNYISLSTRLFLIALVVGLFPLAIAANQQAPENPEPQNVRSEALRPSELASLVLSVAALTTAGIALSRTRKRHHS